MDDYTFTILSVNLSDGRISEETIKADVLRKFVGGSALAANMLYPHLKKELDPLSPQAPLLFLTGPLTGTAGPSVGRYVICAKSPATGLWSESNIGGHFGPELRAASYEGLIVRGRSTEPCYLWIKEDDVEIRSAEHLWGRTDTYETQDEIKRELGQPLARVACIGMAGEERLRYALVLCDHGRVAGRTGMGAVMGAKGLKAIAVRGKKPIPIMKPEAFKRTRRKMNITLREDNVTRAFHEYGTSSGADYLDYLGEMPKYDFTRGSIEGVSKISGMTVAETILKSVSACHGCTIACGRVVKLENGESRKGPEYETIMGFGPNIGNTDMSSITMMGELCDRYGMDTISVSNVIGLAFHLYSKGILTEKDAQGLDLTWGKMEVVEELIHKIIRREGLGALLAEGAREFATHFGVPELAAQVNGLEMPYHDPRGASGMALVYATSPRGACHNQSDYFWVDTLGRTEEDLGIVHFDRHEGAAKAANVARHQDWQSLRNALIMCEFSTVSIHDLVDLINQATGFDFTIEELMEVGERSWNLKRAINNRMGLTRKDDRLPEVFLKELPNGGSAGYVPPFKEMLEAYYKARDWDPVSGRPNPNKLNELGLTEVVEDIWKGN
jgi:aldehyde:ferredoxin oxidoreductase